MRRAILRLPCLAMLLSAGCWDSTAAVYDPYYYDYGYYDAYYYSYDTAYAYTWVDPIYDDFYAFAVTPAPTTPFDATAAAAKIASTANTYYLPAGCAQATSSGGTVSYAFNNCSGPGGLVGLNGNVTLTLSSSQSQLSFSATSSGLSINGDPYNLNLQGTGTQAGTQRVLTLTSGSFSPSRLDSRSATATASWTKGSGCFTVNGQSQSTRGDKSATATLTDYNRCTNQCPTSGTVTVETSSGVFTANFDGGATTQVSGPNGSAQTYDLRCQ